MSGFSVNKPVKFWQKPLKANFSELFKALGKATVNWASGNGSGALTDAVDALGAIGLTQSPEEVAWGLIYISLRQAIFSLVDEHKDLLVKQPSEDEREALSTRLSQHLEEKNLYIDEGFLRQPKVLPILEDIQSTLTEFLEILVSTPTHAKNISNRLPAYFVMALHEEWANHPDKYIQLIPQDTPFSEANQREQAWLRYFACLEKEVEKALFGETFSLKSVYIPLHAYYQRKIQDQEDHSFNQLIIEDKLYERVVCNLQAELENWLLTAKH